MDGANDEHGRDARGIFSAMCGDPLSLSACEPSFATQTAHRRHGFTLNITNIVRNIQTSRTGPFWARLSDGSLSRIGRLLASKRRMTCLLQLRLEMVPNI